MNTEAVLTALRAAASNLQTGRDGRRWGEACVADVQKAMGMSARRFAGHLSALEARQLWEPCAGTGWGSVVLADGKVAD